MALLLDLEKDFAQILGQRLAAAGYPPITGESSEDTIMRYLNVLNRRIDPRPRQTKKPSAFSCPPELQAGLDGLLNDSEAGSDLRPYQSTGMETDNYDDGMLNAWGLHHFHLGMAPHPRFPTYKARTGPLLYAVVADNTLYCLAVLPHKQWSNQQLIELLDKNFPELVAPYTSRREFLAVSYSDSDVQKLRDAGINALTQTASGRIVFPPGGGVNLSKTKGQKSAKVVQANIELRRHLKELENGINQQAEALGVPDGYPAVLTEKDGKLLLSDAAGALSLALEMPVGPV